MNVVKEAIEGFKNMVNKNSDPLATMEEAREYLSRFDQTEVVHLDDVRSELRFTSTRSAGPGAPYDDSGSFKLMYDQKINDWDCDGYLFRTRVNFDHPKLFFVSILSAAISELRLKQQILDRTRHFLDRYAGDEQQFAYRLGIDLGAVAQTRLVTTPGDTFAMMNAGGKYSPGTSSTPDFELWFSRKTTALGQIVWRFGFIEPSEFHIYELNDKGISACNRDLDEWQKQVEFFLQPLISMQWK